MAKTKPLDWDDLRTFLAATRAGSLAGAARALLVEHTTIGRRLTSLEKAIGAPLVLRRPDGLKLTPLGEQLKPLVADVERAVLAVAERVAAEKSRVRLAAPSGFTRMLGPHLERFRREHPDITVEILSSSHFVDLARGEADLALRAGPCGGDELIRKKIGSSPWSLYASDAYLARHAGRIDPGDLAGHEVIGFEPGMRSPGAQWLEANAAGARIVLRGREMVDLVAAAAAGHGVAILPCMLADTDPALRRVTSEILAHHEMSLLYRKEMKLAGPVRAVMRLVADVIAGLDQGVPVARNAK